MSEKALWASFFWSPNNATRVTRGAESVVRLKRVLLTVPYMLTGRFLVMDDYDGYDEFWEDWHAKYDRYRTIDGSHKLNQISLPSEWPVARTNAVCTCGYRIVNGANDESVLRAFQAHLDDREPKVLDLSKEEA